MASKPSKKSSSSKLAADAIQLLHENCFGCHNAEKRKGGVQLTSRESLVKRGDAGPVLVPGKPDQSRLVKALDADADPHMPPKKQLSDVQINLMRQWILAGAPWDKNAFAKASAPRRVELGTLPKSYHPVLALALSPNGRHLAVARGNRIVIHDVGATNNPVIADFEAHREAVRALAWSPDDEHLASGSFRELAVWTVESQKVENQGIVTTPAPKEEAKSLAASSPVRAWMVSTNLLHQITALRFSPYGGVLLAADSAPAERGWIRMFTAEGKQMVGWPGHTDTIYDLTISPDGGLLATAGGDKVVKLWELVSQKEIAQIEAHTGAVSGAAFHPNGGEIASCSADKQLQIIDVKTRQSVVTSGIKKHGFNCLAWSADGKTVVTADEDGRLFRFTDFKRHTGAQSSDMANEREIGRWPEPVQAIALSVDGSKVFAGLQDGSVQIVSVEGKQLSKLEPVQPAEASAEGGLNADSPTFVHDVLPALAKAGCMAGSCHAKAEGQNGFKLSVFSYDPKSDYQEIVQEGRGRRVFPSAPEESLVLLKPAGRIEHGGGQRFEVGSETYRLLAAWIRGGMIYQRANEPLLASIRVEPKVATYAKRSSKQLRVVARYSDGSERDVTKLADYVSNEKEIAKVDEGGVVEVGTLEGEGVIVTRFMGLVDAARITVPVERRVTADRYATLPVNNFVDRLAYAQLKELGLFPSDGCSDSEFLRRSSLDAIGILPTADQARAFLV